MVFLEAISFFFFFFQLISLFLATLYLVAVLGLFPVVVCERLSCCGFSCCRAQPLEHEPQSLQLLGSRAPAQQLQRAGLVAVWHVRSPWMRDWTHVPCIGRQALNPWPPGKSWRLNLKCRYLGSLEGNVRRVLVIPHTVLMNICCWWVSKESGSLEENPWWLYVKL